MDHACCGRGDCRAAIESERTVGDVVRDSSRAREVMDRLGINHCCGAGLTLRDAAAAAGVPLDDLLDALAQPEKARA
jgi:iron-sulfur cluster repair protein YtfE (RIC family)